MKKVFICLMAVAALTLTSCGGKNNENDVDQDEVSNSDCSNLDLDQTLTEALKAADDNDEEALAEHLSQAQAIIEDLQLNGEEEKAQEYAEKLQAWYEENKTLINKVAKNFDLSEIVDKATDVAGITEGKFKEAVQKAREENPDEVVDNLDQLQENVENLGEELATNGKEVVNDAKEKLNEKKEEIKNNPKAKEAVDKAKEKANEGKQKLGEKVNEGLGKIGL